MPRRRLLPLARGVSPTVLAALPLLVVFAAAVFLIERDGGYAPSVWYPSALVVLAVLVTLAVALRELVLRAPRIVLACIGAFAAFTLWAYASIGWAQVRSVALDGSNRGLLYLVVFAFVAAWPLRSGAVWPLLLLLSAAVAAEGCLTVAQASRAADPSEYLIGARLSEPLGYPNATGALFMMMAWLMVGVASRRFVPVPARALAFGLAGLHGLLNLLTESRGSIYTLPAVVIAYFVLVPRRLASVPVIALVALGTWPAIGPVLDVYGGTGPIGPRLAESLHRSVQCAGALVLVGAVYAYLDSRIEFSPRVRRISSVVVVTALATVLIGLAVAVRPWAHVQSSWSSFKYGSEPQGASHFGGLGSNRYDFWRVGLIEFRRHPVAGIGTDNFLVPYLQLRRSGEAPAYPHSLAIRLLSQGGVVGTVLFLTFLGLIVGALLRIPPGREREAAGILGAAASVWLLHGLVDWLWEMPVLGVLGIALLGGICALVPRAPARTAALGRLRLPKLAVAGVATVAGLICVCVLVFPWLSIRDASTATGSWQQDPDRALSLLSRAARLNPLSEQPDVLAGLIASKLHRYEVMKTRFRTAVSRSPSDWYANFELGVAASRTGDRALARRSLERAAALNPGEAVVQATIGRFRAGKPLDPDTIDRAFAEET